MHDDDQPDRWPAATALRAQHPARSSQDRFQTSERHSSENDASEIGHSDHSSMADHQRILCIQNNCDNTPGLAAVFGHTRIGHALTNALVRGGVRAAVQLRGMSDDEILNIRGIGPKAFRAIRGHFASPGPEESNSHRWTDLEGQRVSGCLFCDPGRSRVLCESAGWYARYDNYPATPGHVEIVPRRHVESWFAVPPTELFEGITLLYQAADLIGLWEVDGSNIGVNDGAAAGRTIDHLHIHLIPRRLGDQPDARGGIRRGLPNGDPDTWSSQADPLSARPARPTAGFGDGVVSGSGPAETPAADQ